MKCSLCGFEFQPEAAQRSCNGCPLVKNCSLVRCPRCGYEMPPEARLIQLLKKLKKSRSV
jgi:rubredoxin